ncbi:uncharacterized hydrophobic domain-containing protein [Maribacter orientalis]|uniref:Uncharacterized hydrophobic domain-containing protein n=1 Tax=Maribacter orientalis TaxID=228957 RepID=A0A1H7JNX5_9FLAO|nr:DUF389 domain-containing protein [Maribacter orientalis]SEK76282.1 uncharacterized hydrophobic domain-containing protein [Maribacter orientalis]
MHIDPNKEDTFIEKNFFSQDISPKERTTAFNSLFFHYKKDWQSSFALMLVISVGIASLGLSEDSSATIIGAMIVAPLGQPIVALGGAIALGWRIQSFRMLGIIILGMISSILIAYIISLTLPDITPNKEMLTRTSPDLRDIGIAILAGAAGAWGYYRSEFSTILSGVAIAVALVPPLCTCGIMLEQGHFILAYGSILLFVTNLIGITFASILVFFVLGLKNSKSRKWFYKGTIATIILGTIIILPLSLNYQKFNSGILFYNSIYEKAGKVCELSVNSPVIKELSIQGTGVIITIEPFPDDRDEEQRLITELERSTGLQVFLQSPSSEQ